MEESIFFIVSSGELQPLSGLRGFILLIQSDRETSDCIWNCIYMDHCRFHGIKYVHVTICLDPL